MHIWATLKTLKFHKIEIWPNWSLFQNMFCLLLKSKCNLTQKMHSVHNFYSCKVKRIFFFFTLDAVNYHNSARDNQFPAHHSPYPSKARTITSAVVLTSSYTAVAAPWQLPSVPECTLHLMNVHALRLWNINPTTGLRSHEDKGAGCTNYYDSVLYTQMETFILNIHLQLNNDFCYQSY